MGGNSAGIWSLSVANEGGPAKKICWLKPPDQGRRWAEWEGTVRGQGVGTGRKELRRYADSESLWGT